MRIAMGLIFLVSAAPIALGQTFDVASVKRSTVARAGGEGSTREQLAESPAGITLRNATLSSCVQLAYGVKFYQVSGPDWLKTEHYDILARATGRPSNGQLNRMLQALLADRFKLQVRHETREVPIYALLIAKGGAKLQSAKGEGSSTLRVVDGSFVFQNTSMPEFAEKLSDFRNIDRPVQDRTGMTGTYDFTLTSAASAMLHDDAPSIFTLLQESVGLKLEPQKGPLEIVVVEHAEKIPTEN